MRNMAPKDTPATSDISTKIAPIDAQKKTNRRSAISLFLLFGTANLPPKGSTEKS